MAFDIQFKLIYQGIRDVFRVRSLSNEYDTVYDISSLHYGLTWDKAVSKNGDVKIQEDPTASK